MDKLSNSDRHTLNQAMLCTSTGDQDDVSSWLRQFITTTQVDEVIIDARIYDAKARCRSYQLIAESLADVMT